jgi:hypothetical protein
MWLLAYAALNMLCIFYYSLQPMQMRKHVALKYLVIQTEKGILKELNQLAVNEILGLSSYIGHQWYVKPGEVISPTIDSFTFGGCIQLANEDPAVLHRDYTR